MVKSQLGHYQLAKWSPNTGGHKSRFHYAKKCGVTECPRGAIFSCFRGNSMGYHGNMKILLPWGVPIHHIFYSVHGLT